MKEEIEWIKMQGDSPGEIQKVAVLIAYRVDHLCIALQICLLKDFYDESILYQSVS
jgi:hypothetical protein